MLPSNQENDPICPFLGMPIDWQTAMDYPSRQNFCRKLKPPAAPDDSYQREFCLVSAYRQCSRFIEDAEPVQKSNPDTRVEKTKKRKIVPGWVILGPIIIIFLLILWLALTRIIPLITSLTEKPPVVSAEQVNSMKDPVVELLPSLTTTATESLSEYFPTEQATVSALEIESTEVLTQTTPAPPHTLEEPFGAGTLLILHRVSAGEDLIAISNTYHTTVEAIQAVNFKMPKELWSDTVIIIPPDQVDLSSIPPMKAYEVTSNGLTVEALATAQDVDPFQLALYNDRPGDYTFQEGEWVVIPQILPTP